MKFSSLRLKDLITSNLLYYSWVDLKSKKKGLFDSKESIYFEPLSKYWFDKTSLLIRSGNYAYNSTSVLIYDDFARSYKKIFMRKLKNKVLENAFLILLRPYFLNSSNLEDINLTECLRL